MCQHTAELSASDGTVAVQPESATDDATNVDVEAVPELMATSYHGCVPPVRKPSAKCLGPVPERLMAKVTWVGV